MLTARQDTAARPWVWWLFRVLTTLLAVDAYAQAILAGRFLSGDFGMLSAHRFNGTDGVAILSFVLIAAAVIAWRKKHAPGHLVVFTSILSGLIVLQIVLGFDRMLGVHIPLGVAIIVLSTMLTVWAWRR
ncbi:hypothetical protein [Actinocrispum sp. NPDC049592]|uniref:hypothetical protein n=1 Tax=Actinocrispum sp. NPDC049592 TaxID=3154835 RepID=UPI0034447230